MTSLIIGTRPVQVAQYDQQHRDEGENRYGDRQKGRQGVDGSTPPIVFILLRSTPTVIRVWAIFGDSPVMMTLAPIRGDAVDQPAEQGLSP